eukprot:CAMPEP_0171654636 /NCGR_PEP_ID=MMETSP0990-20121206/40356_1 /TAXON_ID=483369 /ORGANISM="non described non described, Strain CCMP2098" /LENGTH=136 /DNA_ID=CAMNT_0012234461 /DNA_START=63 /DNA_END=473 /DNA_ORIENTATION=-
MGSEKSGGPVGALGAAFLAAGIGAEEGAFCFAAVRVGGRGAPFGNPKIPSENGAGAGCFLAAGAAALEGAALATGLIVGGLGMGFGAPNENKGLLAFGLGAMVATAGSSFFVAFFGPPNENMDFAATFLGSARAAV